MQEIAIILGSVAGLATGAAFRKFPKGKTLISLGANSQIQSKIHSLKIEKEILTKTISRLYQHQVGLTKIQRDKLLIRYQHQLGVILAKIEKLEEASKHPDLGPVGDGLITLMDQKLSRLDDRLYELSSRITIANSQISQTKEKQIIKEPEPKIKQKINVETDSKDNQKEEPKIIIPKRIIEQPINIPEVIKPKRVEITTLTEIPTRVSQFPFFEQKPKSIQYDIIKEQLEKSKQKPDEKVEILQNTHQPAREQPKPEFTKQISPVSIEAPKPKINLPEEENLEDEDEDLDKIKGEIMKTLSKLEQAEVE